MYTLLIVISCKVACAYIMGHGYSNMYYVHVLATGTTAFLGRMLLRVSCNICDYCCHGFIFILITCRGKHAMACRYVRSYRITVMVTFLTWGLQHQFQFCIVHNSQQSSFQGGRQLLKRWPLLRRGLPALVHNRKTKNRWIENT